MDDYQSYLNGISFRYLQPDQPVEPLWDTIVNMRIPFEFLNTDLPADELEMKVRLMKVYGVPKMSTLAMGAIINRGVSQMPAGTMFLNVGVLYGYTLLCGMVGNADRPCVGVDNFSEFDGPRDACRANFARFRSAAHQLHEGDYEAYFERVHEGPVGFYLFDGPHTYEHQLKGLQLAERFLADGCIVMIDDTNHPPARQATLDFVSASKHRYDLLLDRPTCANMHPTWWNGVMIYRKEA